MMRTAVLAVAALAVAAAGCSDPERIENAFGVTIEDPTAEEGAAVAASSAEEGPFAEDREIVEDPDPDGDSNRPADHRSPPEWEVTSPPPDSVLDLLPEDRSDTWYAPDDPEERADFGNWIALWEERLGDEEAEACEWIVEQVELVLAADGFPQQAQDPEMLAVHHVFSGGLNQSEDGLTALTADRCL